MAIKIRKLITNKCYKLLYGNDDKNDNILFNSWRVKCLERSADCCNSGFAWSSLLESELSGHWVMKPMGHRYRQQVTRIRLLWTIDILHEHIGPMNSVLDVGAASGVILNKIQSDVRVGVDTHLDCCKRIAQRGHLACVCNAESLPFRTGSFDWVLLLEVIEHLRNPLLALEECKRVSRMGVIISTPNFSLSSVATTNPGAFMGDAHVWELALWDWLNLFEHAGLYVQDNHTIDLYRLPSMRARDRALSRVVGQNWPSWHLVVLRH